MRNRNILLESIGVGIVGFGLCMALLPSTSNRRPASSDDDHLAANDLSTEAESVLATDDIEAETEKPYFARSKKPHHFTVLNHGTSAMDYRLKMIEGAKESIDFESFIVRNDRSGRLLMQALCKKAREGVRVRFLLDYPVVGKDAPYLQYALDECGVETRYFHRRRGLIPGQPRTGLMTGHSDHRKNLIVDGEEDLVGGRNVGDEYTEISHKFNHLDREVAVKGPVVRKMVESFEVFWNSPLSKPMELDEKRIQKEIAKGEQSKFHNALTMTQETDADRELRAQLAGFTEHLPADSTAIVKSSCNDITFVSDLPNNTGKDSRKVSDEIYSWMGRAQHDVFFDSPVFIDTKLTKATMNDLLDRGVKVKVYMSGLLAADDPIVGILNDDVLKWVKREGFTAYVHNAQSIPNRPFVDDEMAEQKFAMHSKSAVLDGRDVMISSYNWDPRSQNIDTQLAVFCEGNPELAAAMTKDMDERLAAAKRLTPENKGREYFEGVPVKMRVKYELLKWPFRIFLKKQS